MPRAEQGQSVRLTNALRAWRTLNTSQEQYERAKLRLDNAVEALSLSDRDRYAKATLPSGAKEAHKHNG